MDSSEIQVNDILFMAEAIIESKKSHDPVNGKAVGCVIVKKNVIVGRGYRNLVVIKDHPYIDICFHAEHIALMEAGDNAKGSTIYCTLEPCAKRHKGSWNSFDPPLSCSEIISNSGVERLVYLSTDNGEGIGGSDFLKSKGIKVDKINVI